MVCGVWLLSELHSLCKRTCWNHFLLYIKSFEHSKCISFNIRPPEGSSELWSHTFCHLCHAFDQVFNPVFKMSPPPQKKDASWMLWCGHPPLITEGALGKLLGLFPVCRSLWLSLWAQQPSLKRHNMSHLQLSFLVMTGVIVCGMPERIYQVLWLCGV